MGTPNHKGQTTVELVILAATLVMFITLTLHFTEMGQKRLQQNRFHHKVRGNP